MTITNQEIRTNLLNWLSALESGQYKQCEGKLRIGDSYCCLGVACDVLDPDRWLVIRNTYQHPLGDKVNIDGWGGNYLQEKTLSMLGLTEEDQDILTQMNDEGKSFTSIADYIRKNILVRYAVD